jgi:hypothetical protein
VTNANSSIAAARFRPRPRKQVLRELEAVLDRLFKRWLSELAMGTNVNLTFKVGLVQDGHEDRNG